MQIADLRFLVVEDQGFQRWVLGDILAKLGAKYVYLAADGSAALNILNSLETPVDIIVSDLDMPNMDGMEFIRHLSEFGVPVSLIITSGLESPLVASVETMAMTYGVKLLGAIQKPATAKKLEAIIKLHRPPETGAGHVKAIGPTFTLEEIVEGLKKHQFEPFFQPKIEVKSGKVRGAEALARWRHPLIGIVAPYAFIKPLEDGGYIDQLTWIMLEKAAACCKTWHAAGFGGTVSVNLSVKSLGDPKVAERVTQIVMSQNIAPGDVIFEITESATTSNLGGVLENLSRLRMRGFGVSIDDYGTGYSSMQQLARVAFTELKIDQSFVRNGSTQGSSRAMLESSLEMASKLNIVAVAEGVEMLVDWDLVKKLDCHVAQGYFIAMPMEAGAYLNWLRERHKRD